MNATMGLDIGTSGCKAVVFAADGAQLASAYRGYSLVHPHEGWAELESAVVVEACLAVIAEAAAASELPVMAVAISSQGEAVIPVDGDGRLLGNALVSSDRRAEDEMADFVEGFGAERLYRITGHTPHPLFTLPKLLWLRAHRPQVWAQVRHLQCFEDLIHRALGCEPVMSYSMAGRTMLFDIAREQWSEEICAAAGIDPGLLPRLGPGGSVIDAIPASSCRQLGLGAGARLVVGGHDQVVAAFGVGIHAAGQASIATGTVECICAALQRRPDNERLMASNHCGYHFAIPGLYSTLAYSLTGGNILAWYRDQIAAGERDYDRLIDAMPAAPSDLLVLPHFAASGTPHFDPAARGAILGLQLTTTREEIGRALLEGVALEMRLNLDLLAEAGVHIDALTATGGGARSRAWVQLKADVLGRPLRRLAVAEAGCLGVAMLARAGLERRDPAQVCRELCPTAAETIDPQAALSERYDQHYERYRLLYEALRPLRLPSPTA